MDLRLAASIAEITTEDGRATGVRLADGSTVDADAVLVAVGVAPNAGLAERGRAGASTTASWWTQALRTEDPDIFAAGDVANAFHPATRPAHPGRALGQRAQAAGGRGRGHARRRGGLRRAAVLLHRPVRPGHGVPRATSSRAATTRWCSAATSAAGEFIAFWLAGGRVLAGMNVNVWDVTDPIKALIRSGAVVDADRLADPDQPLESLLHGLADRGRT